MKRGGKSENFFTNIVGGVQVSLGVLIFVVNLIFSFYYQINVRSLFEDLSSLNYQTGIFQSIINYLPFIKWAIFGVSVAVILQGIINLLKKK